MLGSWPETSRAWMAGRPRLHSISCCSTLLTPVPRWTLWHIQNQHQPTLKQTSWFRFKLQVERRSYAFTALPQPCYFQLPLCSSSAHPRCPYSSWLRPGCRSTQASVPCVWHWLCPDFHLLNLHTPNPLLYLPLLCSLSRFPLFTLHAWLSGLLCVNIMYFVAVLNFIKKLELHMTHVWGLNVLVLLTLTFEYYENCG